MTARDSAVAPLDESEIRAALDRVIASPHFRASPRLASFLRFVVEAVLEGRSDRVKEYSIAVGALGRNDTFDPQTNPIVRVEAGRLRQALERYYVGLGRQDPLVIELRRGSYVPTFDRRRIVYGLRAFAVHVRRRIPRAVRRRFRFIVAVACIAASVSIAFDLAFMLAQRAIAPASCVQTTTAEPTNIAAERYAGVAR